MKIKLIDVRTDGHEAETGTCELCFGSMWVDEPVFIFEDERGTQFEVNGYYWSWGDYVQVYIDNYIDFGAWIATKDFPDDIATTWTDYYSIFNFVDEYEDSKCQEEQ